MEINSQPRHRSEQRSVEVSGRTKMNPAKLLRTMRWDRWCCCYSHSFILHGNFIDCSPLCCWLCLCPLISPLSISHSPPVAAILSTASVIGALVRKRRSDGLKRDGRDGGVDGGGKRRGATHWMHNSTLMRVLTHLDARTTPFIHHSLRFHNSTVSPSRG
jgi:hypothetical protein